MKSSPGLKIGTALVALAGLLAGAAAADDSQDSEFLAGLRARRLFSLAESYCEQRLAEPDFSEARQAEIVAELSVTLVERALHSLPEEREPLWRKAWEVTEQFAERYPAHPRLLLVRTQGALAQVARGELGRLEAEVLADGQRRLEETRAFLRQAIRTLGELAQEAESTLRERSLPGRHSADTPGALTIYQLATLLKQIQYQTARALRNQALCHAPDSADRSDALAQAVGVLGDLARLDASDPLAWPSRIDEIICHRLLGDFPAAERKIEAARALAPPEAAAELLAEQIRLDLAAGRLTEAVATVNQFRDVTVPQLDCARLETALAAWRAAEEAGQDETASQWQTVSAALAQQIAQSHGPYWSGRAKLLLAGTLRSAPGGGSVDMWSHAAESAYLGGQFDEALAAYDQAYGQARQQGEMDRAFELGFLAATVERQRGRIEEALRRYRDLARAQPTHEKAPEAHRLAIEQAAQAAASGPPESVDRFAGLLAEHLQSWPSGRDADDVRWQLGRLHEARQEWAEAIALYQKIDHDFLRFDDVVQSVSRCCQRRLQGAKAAGEPVEMIAADTARWFEGIALGADGRPPERWSPRARQAVLLAAEFWLQGETASGFDRAEWILLAALAAPDAPAPWRSAAQAMRIYSLAGQGRLPEASALLAQLHEGSPDRLLASLEGLAKMARGARENVRRELAQLQLRTVDLLRRQPEPLTDPQRHTLERLAARALADSGRKSEAVSAYGAMAEAYPDDGQIQEEYAELLTGSDDRAALELALARWREIERRSPAAGERWFRAKYSVALLHYRLGNPQQACRIIALLQVIHPELGGPQLRASFLALQKACGG